MIDTEVLLASLLISTNIFWAVFFTSYRRTVKDNILGKDR